VSTAPKPSLSCAFDISDELVPTLEAVRANCHISDARHATDYTLCVYLLKMREYYRWENDLPYSSTLPHQELTAWLSAREELWETVAGEPFESIPLTSSQCDPFDADTINRHLNQLGYVYSSGIGRNMRPHFFLGTLDDTHQYDIYTLYISGREYARDLTSPPAMSLNNTIFIRRESLRRMLWEKIEEWRWNRPANAMQKAINCYSFDTLPEQALDEMTNNEIRSVMLHEIGEVMVGNELGGDWEELLASVPHSKTELLLRAVRDHAADALSTLPELLNDITPASLHFYIANLTNLRKSLFPGLLSAYENWARSGSAVELNKVASHARGHWLTLAHEILELYRHQDQGCDCQDEITALVEQRIL
jgi:hypothetical protein